MWNSFCINDNNAQTPIYFWLKIPEAEFLTTWNNRLEKVPSPLFKFNTVLRTEADDR